MPRVTRAALRTNAILEDEANMAAATPLPLTPTVIRPPLGEVAGNVNADALIARELEIVLKPVKKSTAKAKKSKGVKKGRKKDNAEKENEVEVLEDDCQSSTSSAAEEACEELLKEKSGDRYQVPMHDMRPITPPSKAVHLAMKKLSPKAQTPRFDPVVHKMPEPEHVSSQEKEDSFVATIETRTPARAVYKGDIGQELNTKLAELKLVEDKAATDTLDVVMDDSFAQHIVARSPIKSGMRIEDSVEAIDALEEAIEKIDESIPAMVDEPQSPVKKSHVKSKKTSPVAAVTKSTTTLTTKKPVEVSSKATKTTAAKTPTGTVRRASPRQSPVKLPTTTPKRVVTPRSTTTRPTPTKTTKQSLKMASSTTTQSPPPISSTAAPPTTKPPPRTHPRVSSVSKPPFVPQRSTKAPTRSTFTLPGDAVSQKLKAQREERLKREDEEKPKSRDFKARPVRKSSAPVVKMTATSRARLSLAKGDGAGENAGEEAKRSVGSATQSSGTARVPIKRISSTASTVSTTKARVSIAPRTPSVRPNTSVPRATSTTSTVPIGTAPTPRGLAVQKARGKEVFGRDRAEKEAKDKERKEKEEAARKARAEAAERGRIASREWAERARGKKAVGAKGRGAEVVGGGIRENGMEVNGTEVVV